tara:strand:- start:3049 stop:3744 length:696 start_codon:yes stop_codon:yes gene_type:complete
MIYTKIIDLIDKYYHHKRISKFCNFYKIKTLVDVGSHKGEFISNFISHLSIKKVYAFEPQLDVFKLLKKKFLKNNKIILNNYAISNKTNFKKLKINRLSSTSSFSRLNKKSKFFKFKNFLIPENNEFSLVKTKTIDKIFKKISLKNSLIKIDVEGHEWEVLQGAKKSLKNFSLIIIEKQIFNLYKGNNFKKIHSFLIKNNFILLKKFRFPSLHFEDRLYLNKKNSMTKSLN